MGFPHLPLPTRTRRGLPALGLALACLLAAAAPGGRAAAQGRQAQEYEVKAAYLYNFAKFVDWPGWAFPDEDAPVVLGVLGENPFGGALDALAGKAVKGRPLAVRRARRLDDLGPVHVLFIADSERARLPVIFEALRGRPVLTVGEMPGFARQGGMINLISAEGSVRFEINRGETLRAGLEVSSKLLRLATLVDAGGGE